MHIFVLFRVSKEVEEIYNFQTCVQVMISLFEMCFCLFLLSTVSSYSYNWLCVVLLANFVGF